MLLNPTVRPDTGFGVSQKCQVVDRGDNPDRSDEKDRTYLFRRPENVDLVFL